MNNVVNNNILGLYQQQRVRRPRQYKHRPSQLLDVYTDEEIRTRYRFRRDTINYICNLLEDDFTASDEEKPGLRFKPTKCCTVIIACVVLHNIAKHLDEEDFEDEDNNFLCDEMDDNPHENEEHITTTFFS